MIILKFSENLKALNFGSAGGKFCVSFFMVLSCILLHIHITEKPFINYGDPEFFGDKDPAQGSLTRDTPRHYIEARNSDTTYATTWNIGEGDPSMATYGGEVVFSSQIVSDLVGYSYVTGAYKGRVCFGSNCIDSSGVGQSQTYDVFVGKLDMYGNWVWANTSSSSQNSRGLSLDLDYHGNVVISGLGTGSVQFGDIGANLVGNYPDQNNAMTTFFAASISSDGNWLWAGDIGQSIDHEIISSTMGYKNQKLLTHATDTGKIYFSGWKAGTHSDHLANCQIVSMTSNDTSTLSTITINSSNDYYFRISDIASDSSEGILIAGNYGDNQEIDVVSFSNHEIQSIDKSFFVAKLDSNDVWQWARSSSIGSAGQGEGVNSIVTDDNDNLYVAGCFSGDLSVGNISVSARDQVAIFVAKIDGQGEWQWATTTDSLFTNYIHDMSLDGDQIFIIGQYTSMRVGNFMMNEPYGNPSSSMDRIYIANLDTGASWEGAVSITGGSHGSGLGISKITNGNIFFTGERGNISSNTEIFYSSIQVNDIDGDGLETFSDLCRYGANGWTSNHSTDNDGDGCRDYDEDLDDDNDGILDESDDFPFDFCANLDTDEDGQPDFLISGCQTPLVEDTDDDGDGWSDIDEVRCGVGNPENPTSYPDDNDNDKICDKLDTDDDNDGCPDNADYRPFNDLICIDTDYDGIDNEIDTDDDNDGYPDEIDAFPLDQNEWIDTDEDGIGNDADIDDDNDGMIDSWDPFPLDPCADTDSDSDGMPDDILLYLPCISTDLITDDDDDGDGILDIYDLCWTYDNSRIYADLNGCISSERDTDGDGIDDSTDWDIDGDGIHNWDDSCSPGVWFYEINLESDGYLLSYRLDRWSGSDHVVLPNLSEWETNWSSDFYSTDFDGDGCHDEIEDPDDDNDGWNDDKESMCGTNSLLRTSIPLDSDADGLCDNVDLDDDGDTINDDQDSCKISQISWMSNQTNDLDSDGCHDEIEDSDDDNDGFADLGEELCAYDPLDNKSVPSDNDLDGVCDYLDEDDDNDGFADLGEELCAYDPLDNKSVPSDNDLDGVCDYLDEDDDNDGILDHLDAYPFDSNRFLAEQDNNTHWIIIGILVGVIVMMSISRKRE